MDKTLKSARQAFLEELSTECKSPSEKNSRFIILHIGSVDEFLEDGLLFFYFKDTRDYYEEMNAEVCEKWFSKIFYKIEDNFDIVIDNATERYQLLLHIT